MPSSIPPLNLAVLAGALSSDPEVVELDSGTRMARLHVRVPCPDQPATSVPVVWWDPPATLERLHADDAVVVTGATRRRFFRTRDGATGSRVEVVADAVLPARQGRRVDALLGRVRDRLTGMG